jgi:superoxide dismutase, Cu-Zn family
VRRGFVRAPRAAATEATHAIAAETGARATRPWGMTIAARLGMKKSLAVIFAVAALVGCDDDDDVFDDDDIGDDDVPPPAQTLVWRAQLTSTMGTALAGDAVVRQRIGADAFTADIDLRSDAPNATRPWHVHFGNCASGGDIVGDPAAYQPLVTSADGAASTSARVTFQLDASADYHVNVHISPADLPTIIACGNLILE